jgi:hypothetical protein
MTGIAAAVGFLWPFADASTVEAFIVVAYVALMLSVLPLGWLVLKRRFGLGVAGPLWPLLFFLVLSGTYALATPPWQTPDEPQHMLYSEIVRTTGASVARGGPDKPLSADDWRRFLSAHDEVLQSLKDVDAWPPGAQAIVDSGQIPGPTEFEHPPFYYVVTAALTEPLGSAPVLSRLAVLRAFGVMAAGWVVWLCGMAGRLLWPDRKRLAETPMAVAAGVPTFAGFAGTVNSDVLANLWAAAMLVVVVSLLVRRTRHDRVLIGAAIGLAVLGVATKRTFLPLLPTLPLMLVIRRPVAKRGLLPSIIGLQLLAGVAVLSLGTGPAAWFGPAGASQACPGARLGSKALCEVEQGVSQRLPVAVIDDIQGRVVTIGFWARADGPEPVSVALTTNPKEPLRIPGPGWQFVRAHYEMPQRLGDLVIGLTATGPARVDGVVLARGRFSSNPPQYVGGRELRWDGSRVKNLFVNGSAEDDVYAAPRWLPRNVRRTFDGVVDASYSVLRSDRAEGSARFVRGRLAHTFGIFWGSAGWDQPPRLLPAALRWILGIIVAAGVVAAGVTTATRSAPWPLRAGALLVATVAIGGFAVLARGVPPTDFELVSGRYLFPLMLPFTVVLTAGWWAILRVSEAQFRSVVRWFAVATHLAFIVFVFGPYRWA